MYTRKNPNGTYRIPEHAAGEFRLQCQGGTCAFFGEHVNALGMYEESGLSPEQAQKLGRVPRDRLRKAFGMVGISISEE